MSSLKGDGSAAEIVEADTKVAARILSESAAHARSAGIPWATEEVCLEPAPKLLELIARSHKVAATEPQEG